MKTIKIRFVHFFNKAGTCTRVEIQKKKWWGWSTITYVMGSYGGDCSVAFSADTPELVLQEVLQKHYFNCKEYIKVIEYSPLKIY